MRRSRGLIYVWLTFVLGVVLIAFLYFVLMPAITMIMAWSEGAYTGYTSASQSMFIVAENVFAYIGTFFLVCGLIWAITNSRKRPDQY